MTCLRFITLACVLAVTGGAGATAAEICHTGGPSQYTDSTRTCVSSVLAPRGRNSYGPDKLGGVENGAWCEGVPGPGLGQSITLHQKPNNLIGSMSFANGYTRTPDLYRANGRIKQAQIETSGGYKKTVTFEDTSEHRNISISPSRISWLRLTILSVYPGARSSDTCVTTFYLNQEDFLEGEKKQ